MAFVFAASQPDCKTFRLFKSAVQSDLFLLIFSAYTFCPSAFRVVTLFVIAVAKRWMLAVLLPWRPPCCSLHFVTQWNWNQQLGTLWLGNGGYYTSACMTCNNNWQTLKIWAQIVRKFFAPDCNFTAMQASSSTGLAFLPLLYSSWLIVLSEKKVKFYSSVLGTALSYVYNKRAIRSKVRGRLLQPSSYLQVVRGAFRCAFCAVVKKKASLMTTSTFVTWMNTT